MYYKIGTLAKRFGITHHRSLRQKASIHSSLEDIPGIGAARRRALLSKFKSIKAIAEASVEELCTVEGIGKKQAEMIWGHYHRTDDNNAD